MPNRRSGGKTRTSISIDPALKERIDQESGLNLSGFVNDTLQEFFETGRRPDGLELRIEMKEQEVERKREEYERAKEELARLKEKEEEREERGDPQFEKAVDTLQDMKEEARELDNPALRNQASKVGVRPEELAKVAWGEEFVSEV